MYKSFFVNTNETFQRMKYKIIFFNLYNSVSKMPLDGWSVWGGGDVKVPRADNLPRAPRNVSPALTTTVRNFCIKPRGNLKIRRQLNK